MVFLITGLLMFMMISQTAKATIRDAALSPG